MASTKKKRKLKNSYCAGGMLKEKVEKGPKRLAFFTPAQRKQNNKLIIEEDDCK